jgi:hypothetical protein
MVFYPLSYLSPINQSTNNPNLDSNFLTTHPLTKNGIMINNGTNPLCPASTRKKYMTNARQNPDKYSFVDRVITINILYQ